MPRLNVRNFPALAIAVGTYVIVAAIFTQSGIILGPAAKYFHADLPATAILFTYLNFGNLGGIFICLFIFRYLTIRQTLFAAYGSFFVGLVLLTGTHTLGLAFAAMTLIGLGVGTGLSAGAVIIAESARDNVRAVAFLATDCAFSGAGFVFPAITSAITAAHFAWQIGYIVVAVLPVLLLVAVAFVRLPGVTGRRKSLDAASAPVVAQRREYSGVILFGMALATYLMGQNTFTIWAPTYLHADLHVATSQAGAIVSAYYGMSSLGLLTAAVLVSRISPRSVLITAVTAGALCTLSLTQIHDERAFFAVTFVLGFSSTCMYKLMLSIGSEQFEAAASSLVTTLLFASAVGGTAAPAISAWVVKGFGTQAALPLAAACYCTTFALIAIALGREKLAKERMTRVAST